MAWDRSTDERWVIELRRRMGADVMTGVIAPAAAPAFPSNDSLNLNFEKGEMPGGSSRAAAPYIGRPAPRLYNA